MADHSKPTNTSFYTDYTTEIDARFDDITIGLDPALTTATNLPTGAIRWNSASNKWQKWSGSAWGELSSSFVFPSITSSSLTSGRVTFASTGGLLADSANLTWDNINARLGIGTGSPLKQFQVKSPNTIAESIALIGNGNTQYGFEFKTDGNLLWSINVSGSRNLGFQTNDVERMRIDSAGNVGIGTASPAYKLDVSKGSSGVVAKFTGGTSAYIYAGGTDVYFAGDTSGNDSYGINSTSHFLNYYTNGIERMRLDSSGNLGLGVTPSAWRSTQPTIQVGTASFGAYNNILANFGQNMYVDSSNVERYITSTWASQYYQYLGAHTWRTAPIGTAGNAITFTQAMTLDASGQLAIGRTTAGTMLDIEKGGATTNATSGIVTLRTSTSGTAAAGLGSYINFVTENSNGTQYETAYIGVATESSTAADKDGYIFFSTALNSANPAERMRIDSSGNLLVGKTASNDNVGTLITQGGLLYVVRSADTPVAVNRLSNDGQLIAFYQATILEGNISVSGTTVSYNGGHLARWSQLLDNNKDTTILKGTVLSNLDDMCIWEKDGVVAENEQLNKMKVSDVEGDTNVAGVFVNWTIDDVYGVDDMNVAMTGDMIIRIAQGVTVVRGDLLMSAGDGTAKPQDDDIIRAKTIAKVTSTHITCTYEDGSYCVPCVLMAC
jgi:predicted RecA/RadA family phage recombinase